MTNSRTYSLASSGKKKSLGKEGKSSSHHRRRTSSGEDVDPTDGAGSLTYSAASSVNSGGSAAGESTDSSFADVMRVLELQDSGELKELIRKEGVSSAGELRQKRLSGTASVASSLNYSTDGESQLEGNRLLQTITGQPSDSYANDGASRRREEEPFAGDIGLMFAPAEPGMIKKKKKRKDKSTRKQYPSTLTPNKAPPPSTSYDSSPSGSVDTPTKSPPDSSPKQLQAPGTPPPHPRKMAFVDEEVGEDEDIWYAKWWMSCFPDAFKNMMPKR